MPPNPIQCSDLFARVFDSHGGSCRHRCACGREHYDCSAEGGWTWAPGEREQLDFLSAKEPDLYLGHDGAVSCMEIGGVSIVYDCKCDTAAKYERFIRGHAQQLAEYLRAPCRRIASSSRR